MGLRAKWYKEINLYKIQGQKGKCGRGVYSRKWEGQKKEDKTEGL
jgi:hypothetical protein